MKKILFLHGFFASGQCEIANALKDYFKGKAEILTPDLPICPKQALELIHNICDKESPDLIIGNSCGAFYAQILTPIVGIPAILGNPHFMMTEFLKDRIGKHQYKSPRYNGVQEFVIDQKLIGEFKDVENQQFDFVSPYYANKVIGLFGEKDTLAGFEDVFREYYITAYHFPGAHTPTYDEVIKYYAPLAENMLNTYNRHERYFRHFKGNFYKFIKFARDSETFQRMVVYQALYGEHGYWVRPEKMFFEKVTRDGKTLNRFTEIDKNQVII